MNTDIQRTDITLFFNHFYDRIASHYKSGTKYLINYELNFIADFSSRINNLTITGDHLTNYTQMIQMEQNWNEQYYQSNKSYQTFGIINWFSKFDENFNNKYFIFKIIKKLLDIKTINFISKDEYEIIKKINNNYIYPLITVSLNKILMAIYSIWGTNYEILIQKNNDHNKILNKYNEILNRYNISNNLCNQPNLNNLYDSTIFLPNNQYKLLLSGSITNDNYDGYFEIFSYLKSYYDVISDYYKPIKVTESNVVINNNNDDTPKVKKTTKKVLDDSNDTPKVKKTSKKVLDDSDSDDTPKVKKTSKKVLDDSDTDETLKVKKTSKKVLDDSDTDETPKVKKTSKKVLDNSDTDETPKVKKTSKKVLDDSDTDKTSQVKKTTTKYDLSLLDFSDNEETPIVKKTKKKSIPATLKRKVWNKYIGEEIGKAKCLCCKLTEITQLSFNCGHIIAESKGGELKMDNLKPICQSCNSSMGTMNMNEYMQKFGF